MSRTVLILPGLFNSDAGHWQTLWETMLPNARRVQQENWDRPNRADWVGVLDAAITAADGPLLLAAHSLGCATLAWWVAAHHDAPHAGKIAGALLVAPPDVEHADFPGFVSGFAPMPRRAFPFPARVIASANDPWCELSRAQAWAADWGARFHDLGLCGHINADSGLGHWPQGQKWLLSMADCCVMETAASA